MLKQTKILQSGSASCRRYVIIHVTICSSRGKPREVPMKVPEWSTASFYPSRAHFQGSQTILSMTDSDDITPSILTPKMNPKWKQTRRFFDSDPEEYPNATMPDARLRRKTLTGKATTFNKRTDSQTKDRTYIKRILCSCILHTIRKERPWLQLLSNQP